MTVTETSQHSSTLYLRTLAVSPKNTFSQTAHPGLCYPGKHHPPTLRAATRARRAFIPMSGVCASRPGGWGDFPVPGTEPLGANSPSGISRPDPPDREFTKRIPQKREPKNRFRKHIPGTPAGTSRIGGAGVSSKTRSVGTQRGTLPVASPPPPHMRPFSLNRRPLVR